MGRSLLYGGKAAECIDIVNRSTLVAALKGNVSQPKKNYFFHEVGFPAMGHVPKDGFEEETDLILYDGAGTRIKLGSNIGVVTPANRFQDGVTMSVSDWCELMERLTIGAEREWR